MQDRTDKPIIITEYNIGNIQENDIVAWTYASPGAMGCPGEITVITVYGNSMWLYRCNYIYHQNIADELKVRFPGIFTANSKGWKSLSMGMGNMLHLRENLEDSFTNKLKSLGKHIYPNHLKLLYQTVADTNYIMRNNNALQELLMKNPEIWMDERRFKALLLDYIPDDKLKRNLILACVQEKIPQYIFNKTELTVQDRYRLEKRIISAYGCNELIANEIIDMWINAINNKKRQDMYLIKTLQGDITKITDVQAIVNAANNSLLGGGGVDGAIHRAAGPELLAECRTLHGCETGQAKITKAYNLPCDYVIHTVGPIWNGGKQNEEELLANCYYNSMKLAYDKGIRTIAFPSISTGAYSFPLELAAKIAVHTVNRFLQNNPGSFDLVEWVLFDTHTEMIYESEVDKLY